MNELVKNINVNITEASTIRGIVWVFGSFVASVFLWFSTPEKAMSVMTITASLAGGLGVAISDKKE